MNEPFGMLNGRAFNQHNGNHADEPPEQFPMFVKSIEKSVSNQSTNAGGYTHCDEVPFQIQECIALQIFFSQSPKGIKTGRSHHDVGYSGNGFHHPNTKDDHVGL